jgi:ATP-dependent DNA helicase RecG
MTVTELQHIITKGESGNLEFKSSFNNELIETLVAFTNTRGGKVIVGITPKKEIKGATLNAESVQNWINEIKSKTEPSILPSVETLTVKDKELVVFQIQEFPIKPVSFRGRYYVRNKNSNHQLGVDEIVELRLESLNLSFDSFPVLPMSL